MRRLSIIVLVVVVILAFRFVVVPPVVLRWHKAQAVKKYAERSEVFNMVPKPLPQRLMPATNYEGTVWMDVMETTCALGFPSDRFTRDDHPKRTKVLLHHAQYRLLISSGLSASQFAPVMEPIGFTNVYDFVLTVFRTSSQDIMQQPSRDALRRHLVLLDTKALVTPVGFDDSCLEFSRGDLKGFIVGDPARRKILYVLVYVEPEQRLIDLGIIPKPRIQMSDLEELICVLKVRPNNNGADVSHSSANQPANE